MPARQTLPRQWLVLAARTREPLAAARRLPRGSGIFIVDGCLKARERIQLRRIAVRRGLTIVEESAHVRRVHDMRELRRAGSAGATLLFLSPLHTTESHPDWKPLPRMRASSLARLSNAPVIALGGMTMRRFATVAKLGFHGWAGIGAWEP